MRNSKKLAAIAGSAVLVLGVGTAYAFWTTTGGGSGSASTEAAAVALTAVNPVVPNAKITALGGATTITAKVSNPATYSQEGGVVTGEPTYPPGCDTASWWTFTPANNAVGVLAAGGSKNVVVGTLTLNNDATENQDACKNATVSFAYDIAAPVAAE